MTGTARRRSFPVDIYQGIVWDGLTLHRHVVIGIVCYFSGEHGAGFMTRLAALGH